ncbi:MAG: AI-2E family transporter [Chitinophagales bacterium]|nr:AI-2E family transporter [Chitinophagales bacterium]
MQNYTFGLIAFIAVVFILYIAKSLLLPLSIAIILWFLIKELLRYLAKIHFKGKYLPTWTQKLFAFALVLLSFFALSRIVSSSIVGINEQLPLYEKNLKNLLGQYSFLEQIDFNSWIQNALDSLDLSSSISYALNSISTIFSNAILVLLYLLFILLESASFSKKLQSIYPKSKDQSNLNFILENIDKSMSSYISLKTVTSLITGFLSYLALKIIGVDFAFFWAFLIFLLNYIPTIGSLLATGFPVLLAFVQFASFTPALIVLASVGAIQFLVGNLLEPKLMGTSLNVSPLIVLISLAFWGWLWGIVGMIISMPITIMMIIVFAQFESTRWMAIILSADGKLPGKK